MIKAGDVDNQKSTVRVGILHALSGTMAISETSLKDAALMAIAEINANGGILGKQIEPIVKDSTSNPTICIRQAEHLMVHDQVVTLFGGFPSASRKALIPLLEKHNILLWYPVEYEGLECSKYIFYTGMCPNQQVKPAVHWLLQNIGKKFYLLGSDYVFPRTVDKLIKAELKHHGGSIVGREYPALGTTDFQETIARIQAIKPDVVFSTLNGDSNLAFYKQYHQAGITAQAIPVMAVSIAEPEIQEISGKVTAGHYAAWNYFQTLDTTKNQEFVENFKAKYGQDRVTSDSIQTAYTQVYLWKQAVETAQSFHTDQVRNCAYNQAFEAPGGLVRLESNHHLGKPCRIGKILATGQFEIVYSTPDLIKPLPWLGAEEFDHHLSPVILDMLAEVPQAIEYNCQLEQKSREVEIANAELREMNQRLQETQDQLHHRTTQFRNIVQQTELLKRRLSSQIRNSLDINIIVSTAVQEIRDLLKIDECQFFWYDPKSSEFKFSELETKAEYHQELEDKAAKVKDFRNSMTMVSLLGEKILELKLLEIDEISCSEQLGETSRKILQSLEIKSLLGTAVLTRTGDLGILICQHKQENRPWSENESELLEAIADQLALAIDQARIYEQSQIAAAIANARAEQLKQAMHNLQQTQAQLVQTEKMSILGQLLAGVAHEINNPVSFIYGNLTFVNEYTADLLGLIELYQDHYPDPVEAIADYAGSIDLDFILQDLPKMLSSMKVGADRIREIVLSLKTFSRRDQNKMQSVDLHEGLDSTLVILRNQLKATDNRPDVEIIKDYGKLPVIECYAGQMNQVFMNILSNAIDALEEKYDTWENHPSSKTLPVPKIQIATETLSGDRILIRISDNGPGMTEEIKMKLYDSFFTTKPIGKGTGLGLAISYQIVVEKHHGALHCDSTLGQGTEFRIELPIRQTSQNRSSISEINTEAEIAV